MNKIKTFLVRGDTHGVFTWMDNGCLDGYIPEETAIIILGDSSFNFWLNKKDERLKREVSAKGFTFYCVRGNHEARPQDIEDMDSIYDENVQGIVYVEKIFHHFIHSAVFTQLSVVHHNNRNRKHNCHLNDSI